MSESHRYYGKAFHVEVPLQNFAFSCSKSQYHSRNQDRAWENIDRYLEECSSMPLKGHSEVSSFPLISYMDVPAMPAWEQARGVSLLYSFYVEPTTW
jgi:hypothetical protein